MTGNRVATAWSVALALFSVLLACSPPQTAPATGTTANETPSSRVENGLVVMGDDLQPRWDERATLGERMSSYAVPGVSIAVIDDFEIAWARGWGVVRADGSEPVTTDTLFHAGSIAKPVSAAATLRLVERGVLDLDADINQSLSSWQVPANELTAREPVTLRRLLSHSAGLEDGLTNRAATDAIPTYATPAGSAPTTRIQDLLNADPGVDADRPTRVTSLPGSTYRYANADYAILELLLRDVTGEPFPAFMHKTVLTPLKMTSSTYEQPLPPELRARSVVEHDVSGTPFPGSRLHFPMVAAGGLWTTPSDLARFALEIMTTHAGRSEPILLPRELVAEMLSPQISISGNPLADAAGLGLELSGSGEQFSFVHTGGTWGSTAILWAYPARGQGAVIMTNSATGSLLRIEILLAIALEYGWPIEEG